MTNIPAPGSIGGRSLERGNIVTKIGTINFNNQFLNIYGSIDDPCFIAVDVAKIIDYANGRTDEMITTLEKDESFKTTLVRNGQRRTVSMITELGLYNILSQSRKPTARMWRRVVHQQLIDTRKARGMRIEDQFDEWDDLLESIYIDEKTGILMQSVTVAGGDVEQVPYEQ